VSPGRNDPCPCGSGKKYKKCCLPKEEAAAVIDSGWLRIRRTEGELTAKVATHMARHFGPDVLDEAWEEYTLWPDQPALPNEWPEVDTSFPAWLMFDWEPEPGENNESDERPMLSPVRHYAESKGEKLDSYELRYIEAACAAPFSFYLVLAAVPGREITLRDIFCRREVTVRERQASATLSPGMILYTKVISLDGDSVMFGCAPYSIPGRYFDSIVKLREDFSRGHDLDEDALHEYEVELRQLYLDLREDILGAAAPELRNSDGDPFQAMRINYELDCSPQEAFDALLSLTLEDDPAAFADESEYAKSGELLAVQIPWLRTGEAPDPTWSNTLLGQIAIRGGKMKVNVNSQARADAIQAAIASRLGDRARRQGIVIESLEQVAARENTGDAGASRSDRERESEALLQEPEIQALLAKKNAEHWHTWPDIPLPALGGQTPREAAATPDGRERLEVILLEFEAHKDDAGVLSPDIAALREELGI